MLTPIRTVLLACLAALAGLPLLASCSRAEPPGGASGGALPTVVCTTGMIADLASRIAADRCEVVALMGAGIDPHLYAPTRSDVAALMGADLVLYNGLLLEGKLTDTLVRAATAGRPVVAVCDGIDPAVLLEPEGFEGHTDPHVWMDPTLWALGAGVIRDRLIALDPEGRAAYEANAAALLAELAALDAYARGVLASVPERSRVLVTAHDAFNYLGRRYGYEVVGIQGISTDSEAGVRDIQRLVDLIVERGIKAVFVESTVSARNISALVDGAAARGHTVTIGGELFSDAMGPAGTYEGTYPGMIDHNVTTIARALDGQAPQRGMSGRLGE